jgi:hypothetical protein
VCALVVLASGSALAQFFRPLVGLPATLVALIVVAADQTVSGHSVAHAMVACISVASALQLSFLAGLLVSPFLFLSRHTYGRAWQDRQSHITRSLDDLPRAAG